MIFRIFNLPYPCQGAKATIFSPPSNDAEGLVSCCPSPERQSPAGESQSGRWCGIKDVTESGDPAVFRNSWSWFVLVSSHPRLNTLKLGAD
jgi:hypothetical protein